MKFVNDFLKQIKPTYDDNAVDRLNYWWTTMITIVLSLVIGFYQFGGKPIVCWSPKEFTKFWDQYLTDYCFVENTYFLSMNATRIPSNHNERENAEIQYYQWIPFILAFQALLFYLPHTFWTLINSQSGINVQKIVAMATDTKNIKFDERGKNTRIVAIHMENSIDLQRDFGGKGNPVALLLRCGKQQGIYVTLSYIIMKLMFVVNVIGQFFMLNQFLNPKYSWWGPGILHDIATGHEWEDSSHFPRVTFCDFEVRRLGNLHRYTVQCVLWINMLNEKVYLFLWFWMLVVAFLTVCDLLYWLFVSLIPGFNRTFVSRFLRVRRLLREQGPDGNKMVQQFLRKLRPDGVFVLRLMALNAGDLITTDIVAILWKRFLGGLKTPYAVPPGTGNYPEMPPMKPTTGAMHHPMTPRSPPPSAPAEEEKPVNTSFSASSGETVKDPGFFMEGHQPPSYTGHIE